MSAVQDAAHKSVVDVVIISWNSGDDLRRCITSLGAYARDRSCLAEITVVDNGSVDGSIDALPDIGVPLSVHRPKTNLGFGAGANAGAAFGDARFVLILNPDVQILDGAINDAVAHLEAPENSAVGIVGVQMIGPDGQVQRSCARFPTPGRCVAQSIGLDRILPRVFQPHFMTDWPHDENRTVDQLIGAFLMIRRDVFEMLGGFDPRFFLYYEDVDLAKRAAAAGWRSDFVANVSVKHAGGGSTNQIPGRRLGYALASRVLYARAHFSFAGTTAVMISALTLEPVARLVRAIATAQWKDIFVVMSGVGHALKMLLSRSPRAGRD